MPSKIMASRLRPAPTGESVLATNAFLNPLLGSALGSVRALSTSAPHCAEARATKKSDPGQLFYAARDTKRRLAANTAKPTTSPAESQTVEKAHLLHDLRPNSTIDAGKAEQQHTSISLEDVTPEAIRSRLADLEAQLAAAEAVDWISLYDAAREDRTLTNLPNYSNLHHNERLQLEQAHQEQYYARTEEIKRDRREHNALMKQLRRSVNALRSYITRQRSASKAENTQVSEAASSQHTQALEDLRRRKQELLKKKDDVAIKLAWLRGGKQPRTGATLHTETGRTSEETTSPVDTSSQDAQGSPSTATSSPHNDDTPLLPSIQAPSEIDVHSLRLHMPNDQLKIDNFLTIDIRPQVSIKQLR